MKNIFILFVFTLLSCNPKPDTTEADKVFNEVSTAADARIEELKTRIYIDTIINKMAKDPSYIPTEEEKKMILMADTLY